MLLTSWMAAKRMTDLELAVIDNVANGTEIIGMIQLNLRVKYDDSQELSVE